jgi:hypothetical protein
MKNLLKKLNLEHLKIYRLEFNLKLVLISLQVLFKKQHKLLMIKLP